MAVGGTRRGRDSRGAVRCGAEAEEMGDGNLVEGWRIYCGLGLGVVGDGQREGEGGRQQIHLVFLCYIVLI